MNVATLPHHVRLLVSALILGTGTMACAVDSSSPAPDTATDAPPVVDGELAATKKDVALTCTPGGACTCPAGQSAHTCPHPFGFDLCLCIKPAPPTQ